MRNKLFLDTHSIIWLAEGKPEMFTANGIKLLNEFDLYISPMVRLELHFLYDRNRFFEQPEKTLSVLAEKINLRIDSLDFSKVIGQATQIKWTRDVFDLFIAAQCQFHNATLLTKNRIILANFSSACW